MRIAENSRLVVVALGGAWAWSTGCLITEDVETPQRVDCPPSVEASASARHPLNEVVRVDLDADAPDGGTGEVVFEAVIRDCNEQQSLQFQALLDFDRDFGGRPTVVAEGTIPPGGRNPHTFAVDFATLAGDRGAGRCHKVELLVTGTFVFGTREPQQAGDLGTAVWWLEVTDETNPTVDMRTCP